MTDSITDMNKKKNILFLTPRFPYPLIGGDRIKSFYILKYLSRYANVTLITLSHGGAPNKEYVQELEYLGIKVHSITLFPFRAALRSISTFWTKFPLEILFYLHPGFRNKVNDIIKDHHFDIAFAFFMRTAEYLKDVSIKKVLIAEDCRALYQSRSAKASANIIQKLVRHWEVLKLHVYEPTITPYFDITTLVTNDDIKEMQKYNADATYALLSNGIDLSIMKSSSTDQLHKRDGLVFIGKLDLWANSMMIQTIVKDILPNIIKVYPQITFSIAGADPSPNIIALASDNIHIYPNVKSTEDFLYQAAIFVHPHKGGSGIQNKVLQAMACGCVVITTPTGIQGIPAIHNEHVFIAHTNEEISSYILFLLENPDKRISMAKQARTLIEDHFSWEAIYKQMDDVLLQCGISLQS